MAAIRIERAHRLGLKRARATARNWAIEAERQHGLRCVVREELHADVYEFTRAGVRGRCVASADLFLLEADLDWALALLRGAIEREIENQLEAAIADEVAKGPARRSMKPVASKRGASKAPSRTTASARKPRPGKR
ncbi:MAG TPA: polyhydroxyalkanoic acid system family protein [Caldimonas sp.]|nr:polyhydroxyalkanoic acid system family protein [Caldimonas sp.]